MVFSVKFFRSYLFFLCVYLFKHPCIEWLLRVSLYEGKSIHMVSSFLIRAYSYICLYAKQWRTEAARRWMNSKQMHSKHNKWEMVNSTHWHLNARMLYIYIYMSHFIWLFFIVSCFFFILMFKLIFPTNYKCIWIYSKRMMDFTNRSKKNNVFVHWKKQEKVYGL